MRVRSQRGIVRGDQTIDDELDLHGIVEGSVRVVAGGILHAHGVINGNVVVATGGRADIQGTVNGAVANDGGSLTVAGVVTGAVDPRSGTTDIRPGAIVNGVRL